MLEINLKGRKLFITGGSRGIGAEICRVFAECGADVAFTYRSSSEAATKLVKELERKNVKALAIQADARDEKAMERAVESTADTFSGLDILVSNVAGGPRASATDSYLNLGGLRRPLSELSLEDWRQGLEMNLTTGFNAIKLIYPHLCRSKRGDILLIGSSAAYDGGGSSPYYATAKAGMGGLTRYLMRELSEKNIRINTIHPCVVDTEGLRRRHDTPEKLERERLRVPLGRLSKPEDIAYLAAFMCSNLCEFITGQSILVDGGRTLWKKEINR
jgi:3-oxoacyl-[acyl-carrier protein] reductase